MYLHCMQVDILASQLAKTPCLRDVDASVLREAARSIRGVTLPGRTQVFKEGDAAASFYVVVQGVLGVYKTNGTCGNIR